jgi:hypothetical protein
MTVSNKINVEEIIDKQFWNLWKEQKLTYAQRFFLELENFLWKNNVVIKNWEIEIIWEENIALINSLDDWHYLENLLKKIQSS